MQQPSVVVTGASSGIGEAAVLRLATMGWKVFAGVRRGEDGERVSRMASGIVALRLDVTDGVSIAEAAHRIERETGEQGLTGLVNNAGIAVSGPLEYLPVDDLRHQLEVNVTGQVAVTQALLPALRRSTALDEAGSAAARIVFMGSIAGLTTSPLVGAYCASKHALEAVADAFRLELAPWRIGVSIIEPGVVFTPIWEKGSREGADRLDRMGPAAQDRYAPLFTAFRRIITGQRRRGVEPGAVAAVVGHALSARRPRSRYVVGRDARLRALLRHLPDPWHDRIVLSVLRRLSAPRPAGP